MSYRNVLPWKKILSKRPISLYWCQTNKCLFNFMLWGFITFIEYIKSHLNQSICFLIILIRECCLDYLYKNKEEYYILFILKKSIVLALTSSHSSSSPEKLESHLQELRATRAMWHVSTLLTLIRDAHWWGDKMWEKTLVSYLYVILFSKDSTDTTRD